VLRVELGPSFRSCSVLLDVPLSLALLSGLLILHRGLDGCCLGGHCNSLLGTCDPGVCCFGTGLRRLDIGNGFDAVRLPALLGLGLLELSLGGQRVVAGKRADDFLRLSLDRVDQPLRACSAFSGSDIKPPIDINRRSAKRPTGFRCGIVHSAPLTPTLPYIHLVSRRIHLVIAPLVAISTSAVA
jgi:hypothetical protein